MSIDHACRNHPDREGRVYCQKYNHYYCGECVKCSQPKAHCKFRTACLIHEFEKYGVPEEFREDGAQAPESSPSEVEADAAVHQVRFEPAGVTVEVAAGTLLHEAAREADVLVPAACNGKGVCGRCRVKIEDGEATSSQASLFLTDQEREEGQVLACLTPVHDDLTVRTASTQQQTRLQVIEDDTDRRTQRLGDRPTTPLVTTHQLTLAAPSLDDPTADLDRALDRLAQQPNLALRGCALPVGVSLEAVRDLSRALRDGTWELTVDVLERSCGHEVIRARPGHDTSSRLGVAIDVGTTALSAELVDLDSGEVLGTASSLNAQVACGDDVISRMLCAAEKGGVERLHEYVTRTINELIGTLTDRIHRETEDIVAVALAGNTVMTHTLLRLDPKSIRSEPYVPVATTLPVLHASDLGLSVHPRAGVFVVPGNAAYVGGDITAGVVAAGFAQEEKTTLFIDVGTNGEMVLGGRDWLLTAACSAGPAFEGGGIHVGMRAVPGAIDSIRLDAQTLEPTFTVVGTEAPRGLCGSGLIDLLSELLIHGVIGPDGKIADGAQTDRVVDTPFGRGFRIVAAEASGTGEDLVLTEADIETLVRTKGAVYGGIQTLLNTTGMSLEDVDQILVAGGFGRHLDLDRAVSIGLLPDVDRDRFHYLGNTSLAGAYLALVSRDHRDESHRVARAMTYQDFSSSTGFFDEYQQALFLPHTDLTRFPSVEKLLEARTEAA